MSISPELRCLKVFPVFASLVALSLSCPVGAQGRDFLLNFDHGQMVMFAQQFRVFCGGGNPDIPRNLLLHEDYRAIGVTGGAEDRCFRLHDDGHPIQNFGENTYFGVVINFTPDGLRGVDLRPYDHISMDVRVGSTSSHPHWSVRIEDMMGSQEWMNKSFSMPELSNQFQRVSIPLYKFTDPLADGEATDLQYAARLVIAGDKTGDMPGPFPVDLYVDNIRITSESLELRREIPQLVFFHHPSLELSKRMDTWFASGDGASVARLTQLRRVDVSTDAETPREYGIFRAPAIAVVSGAGTITHRIQYDGDYDKFCAQLEAATGLVVPRSITSASR